MTRRTADWPPHPVTLADGSEVILRRVGPEDAPELESGFARLSEESRRLRFLSSKPTLTQSELEYLTDVDGHRHEAIGAIDPEADQGVGIARFVRDAERPERAEVAVTVVDDWQHRGLGTALLEAVTQRAREEGVRTFVALVSADNASMHRLLERVGGTVHEVRPMGRAAEYEIELEPRGLGTRLEGALRAAAEGYWHLPPRLWEALRALVPVQLRGR